VNTTYQRYELLRLFRNKRFLIFSLLMPFGLYLTIAGGNRDEVVNIGFGDIEFPLFYMVSMAGYGSMLAAMSSGGRVAMERSVGWNRQLRLTPLSPAVYFATKVLTGYVMAVLSIVLIYAAGLSFGVRLSAAHWAETTGLILVAVVPFAAGGLLLGHLLTADSVGPALGGLAAFFAILGGIWFPLPDHGFIHELGQLLPSYWIGQAARTSYGGAPWPAKAWLVIAVWTVVLTWLTARAYRRDTGHV
jgi:ABC-2 type transport system permease protein